ncbi:hypothetical protein C8R45DRAFT_1076551 [Mycena sanguinolenta]|nr:hypothetical protein C8R45DRAFT_1076551 [Mycena sanguinolenta]
MYTLKAIKLVTGVVGGWKRDLTRAPVRTRGCVREGRRRGGGEDRKTLGTSAVRDDGVVQVYMSMSVARSSLLTAVGYECSRTQPPYGDVDDRICYIVAQLGLETAIWKYDSFDWMGEAFDGDRPVLSDGTCGKGSEADLHARSGVATKSQRRALSVVDGVPTLVSVVVDLCDHEAIEVSGLYPHGGYSTAGFWFPCCISELLGTRAASIRAASPPPHQARPLPASSPSPPLPASPPSRQFSWSPPPALLLAALPLAAAAALAPLGLAGVKTAPGLGRHVDTAALGARTSPMSGLVVALPEKSHEVEARDVRS